MDWLMLVEPDYEDLFEYILINVEFQTGRVGKDKIKIISEYRDYAKTYYGLPVLSVIVITSDYASSELEYSRVSSDVLKPTYIHMEFGEIIERLNNLEDKIINHTDLNDGEALDMVFLPMFAPKQNAEYITEKIINLFNIEKTLSGAFRDDIGFSLSIMVKKYFNQSKKAKELLKMLEREVENTRLRAVVDFEVDYIRKDLEKQLEDFKAEFAKKEEDFAKKEEDFAKKEEDFAKKEEDFAKKEEDFAKKEADIANLEQENNFLKAKLKENGIEY